MSSRASENSPSSIPSPTYLQNNGKPCQGASTYSTQVVHVLEGVSRMQKFSPGSQTHRSRCRTPLCVDDSASFLNSPRIYWCSFFELRNNYILAPRLCCVEHQKHRYGIQSRIQGTQRNLTECCSSIFSEQRLFFPLGKIRFC